MSCNEKSLGQIIIPSNQWSNLKKTFEAKYKSHLEELYDMAKKIHTDVKEKKGTVKDLIELKKLSFYDENLLKEALLNKENKLISPKKALFSIKSQRSENKERKTLHYFDDSLEVIFVNKERMVIYETDDNNHAVDDADSSFVGKTILSLLDRVTHSNRTGGYFKYESEYSCDDNGFSRGPRVTKRYGKYATNRKYLNQDKCDLF